MAVASVDQAKLEILSSQNSGYVDQAKLEVLSAQHAGYVDQAKLEVLLPEYSAGRVRTDFPTLQITVR